MIVYNKTKRVLVFKKIKLPDLRIFPEHNEIDEALLKKYCTVKINKALLDENCFIKKEALSDEEKQQANEAIQKNIKLNKMQNPALLIKVKSPDVLLKQNDELRKQLSSLTEKLEALENKMKKK